MSSQLTIRPAILVLTDIQPLTVARDSTSEVTSAFLEARKSNDPKLIESTYQQCLDHFRGNHTDTQIDDQQNQADCSSAEKSSAIAILSGLWDYFTKVNLLELTLSTAQDALSLLMDTYTKVLTSIKECESKASGHIRKFIIDLTSIILSKEGNALTKAVTLARYINFRLRPFLEGVTKLVAMSGNVFYYEFWKLEVTKVYFRTIVLAEPIYTRLSNGVQQALVVIEDLRVRVLNHPLTQDLLWVCHGALSCLVSLGSAVLNLLPASALSTVQHLLTCFTYDVASQCFKCALLFALGKATGNVFNNQQQVVDAIGRLCAQLRKFFFKCA